MKRRQKRYTDERDILAEIHDKQRRAEALLKSSIELDEVTATKFKSAYDIEDTLGSMSEAEQTQAQIAINNLRHEATTATEKSQKQNKARNRILNIHLPKLKNTLAAFRTETMPFCGTDKGVVLA